jgi:hypothetical protein
MKKKVMPLAVASIMLCCFAAPAFSGNVAKNKPVAGWGAFFTGGWGNGLTADFSTVTDGNIFAKGHPWDQGTVWWQEDIDTEQNFLKVFLGPRVYKINKIIIQVDNDDEYVVSWEDKREAYAASNPQKVVVTPEEHWGMDKPVTLRVDAVTDAFKIEHFVDGKGDNMYSVSEFQAVGYVYRGKVYTPPPVVK